MWRLAKTAVFSFSTCPLSIFHLIGVLSLSLFVGLAGFSLYCKVFTDLAIPGWTSHILSASFFGALNALGISILGEYVIRIYDQVRARPIYVVDRRENFPDPTLPGMTGPADSSTADEAYLALLDEVQALRAAATAKGETVKGETAASGEREADVAKEVTDNLSEHLNG